MKKILILLLVFLTIPIIKIKALEKFYWGDIALDYKITAGSGDMKYNYYPTAKLRSDGSVVYCIEMFKAFIADTNYQVYDNDSALFNLDSNLLNKINLIGYYGYNYPGHEDIKWYGLTQYLIWKEIGLDYIYFTDDNDNKVDVYKSELNELNNLISNHEKLPSFANTTFEYIPDKDFEIIDTNNILSEFDITYTNLNVKKIDNKLYINKSNNGNYVIEFKKKKRNLDNYYLYYLEEYQALFKPGNIPDITFKLNINIDSGNITIYKQDSEGILRSDATLKGAIYGVYNTNDGLIYSMQTDESGIAKITNVPFGEYYVKEISPSYGYRKSLNINRFKIEKNNRNIIIYSNEEAIKNSVVIKKYYEDIDGFKLEKDTLFDIYKNNDLIGNYTTNEYGSISLELDYGNYTIKQLSGMEGYDFIEDFNFTIDNAEPKEIKLYNNITKKEISITKYYGEDNNYKLESNASFNLYKDNKLIGSYITDENGIIILNLSYGNYTLKQISGINGYNYIDDCNFEVSSTSLDNIELYNDLILVDVQIIKYYGEDNNYYVEEGTLFELYKDNNLIDSYTTNELGIINLKLSYGNYVLKQISGIEGYKYINDYKFTVNNSESKKIELYNKIETPIEEDNNELLVVEVPNTGINYNSAKYIYIIIIGILITISSVLIKKNDN